MARYAPPDPNLKAARRLVERATETLVAVMAKYAKVLTNDELARAKKVVKRGARPRMTGKTASEVQAIASDMMELAGEYARRPLPSSAEEADRPGGEQTGGASEPTESNEVVLEQALEDALAGVATPEPEPCEMGGKNVAPLTPSPMPVSSDASREPDFPALVHSTSIEVDPAEVRAFRADVGSRKGDGYTDADFRFELVAPLLAGMTPEEVLNIWHDPRLRAGLFGSVPAKYVQMYRRLHKKTLLRWSTAVEEGLKAEAEGVGPEEGTHSMSRFLQSKYPKQRVGRRKVDPALVLKILAENKNWTPRNVADYLRLTGNLTVSVRRIQQIVAENKVDIDRANERGGDAAHDVMCKTRLLRDASAANLVWHQDNSFLKMDAKGNPLDMEFDVRRLMKDGESWEPVRLHVSAIEDSYSRMVVNFRLWDTPPNALETVVVIAEAGMRCGLPVILHTDNGSEYHNRVLARAATVAGFKQVLRLPHEPEGGGKIERWFLTLKTRILPLLPGWRGGRLPVEWAVEDLLTVDELDAVLRRAVDLLYNNLVHSSTGRKPSELFEESVGMRRFVSPERIAGLLVRQDTAFRRSTGVQFKGGKYWGPCLAAVVLNSPLVVHYIPWDLSSIHVSSPSAAGRLEYLGQLKRLDREDSPHVRDVEKAEAAFVEQVRSLRPALSSPADATVEPLDSGSTSSPASEGDDTIPSPVAVEQCRPDDAPDVGGTQAPEDDTDLDADEETQPVSPADPPFVDPLD